MRFSSSISRSARVEFGHARHVRAAPARCWRIAASTVFRTRDGFALRGSVAKHPGSLLARAVARNADQPDAGGPASKAPQGGQVACAQIGKTYDGVSHSSGRVRRPARGGGRSPDRVPAAQGARQRGGQGLLKIPDFGSRRHVRGCGMLQGWVFCALTAVTSISRIAASHLAGDSASCRERM